MDLSTVGPFDWLMVPANGQGLLLAVIAACCMSVVTLLYKGVGLVMVLLGVLMAVAFTVAAIPLAAFIFHLAWPWWPIIGLFMGVASLRIVRGLDVFAEKLEARLPGAGADRVTSIVRGGAPSTEQPPPGLGDT